MPLSNYSLNFPHDNFTYNSRAAMYSPFAKEIKEKLLDDVIKERYTLEDLKELLVSSEMFNVPEITTRNRTYMFKVADIDSDNIVSLEWCGYYE